MPVLGRKLITGCFNQKYLLWKNKIKWIVDVQINPTDLNEILINRASNYQIKCFLFSDKSKQLVSAQKSESLKIT